MAPRSLQVLTVSADTAAVLRPWLGKWRESNILSVGAIRTIVNG